MLLCAVVPACVWEDLARECTLVHVVTHLYLFCMPCQHEQFFRARRSRLFNRLKERLVVIRSHHILACPKARSKCSTPDVFVHLLMKSLDHQAQVLDSDVDFLELSHMLDLKNLLHPEKRYMTYHQFGTEKTRRRS